MVMQDKHGPTAPSLARRLLRLSLTASACSVCTGFLPPPPSAPLHSKITIQYRDQGFGPLFSASIPARPADGIFPPPDSRFPGTWDEGQWRDCFRSQPEELDYVIEDVEGEIPPDFRGTFVNLGPALFERGGRQVKNWLDGDGQLTCIRISDGGQARVRTRFVRTREFEEEDAAGAFLYRGQFGTLKPPPPSAGDTWQSFLPAELRQLAANLCDTRLKNPSNTKATYWGGRLLSHYEANLPYQLDPSTLETVGEYTFGGMLRSGQAVTSNHEVLKEHMDKDGGHAFTAHTRIDASTGRLVGWTWRLVVDPGTPDSLEVTLYEWESAEAMDGGRPFSSTTHVMRDCVAAPHDFAVTENYYVMLQNRFDMDLPPFLLGLKPPVDCMIPKGDTAIAHIIPRPSGSAAGRPAVLSSVPSHFFIHYSHAYEDDQGKVLACASSWPAHKMMEGRAKGLTFGQLLGGWSRDEKVWAPDYLTDPRLRRLEVDLSSGQGSVTTLPGIEDFEADFPKVHPSFESRDARHLHFAVANDRGQRSRPQGYAHLDLRTGQLSSWYAGPRRFVSEAVIVPRGDGDNELDGYLVGLLHDGSRSSLCIFHTGPRLSEGPTCTLHLKHHVPWGVHASFALPQDEDGRL